VTTLDEPPRTTEPAPPRRWRWWLLGGTVVWLVVLLGAAALSYHRDAPTVREQRTVAEASPVVDRAAGELVAAAWGEDATVEISRRRLVTGCRITPALDGGTLARSVTVRTVAANAPAVLDRIASGLPAGYDAAVRHNDIGGVHRLRADAGEFVAVNGAVTAPGVISLTVQTGCRPHSPGYDPEAGEWSDREHAQGAKAFVIGERATDIEVLDVGIVPCPGGGLYWSQTAAGRAAAPAQLREVVRRLPIRLMVDTPDRIAFSAEGRTVDVRSSEGRLVAAVTTTRGRC
jgi:hypothetical protein